MPLMIYVGEPNHTRRSKEALAKRAANAAVRGWTYERIQATKVGKEARGDGEHSKGKGKGKGKGKEKGEQKGRQAHTHGYGKSSYGKGKGGTKGTWDEGKNQYFDFLKGSWWPGPWYEQSW